jgi:DNA polymerase III epsilon subunit-like protein
MADNILVFDTETTGLPIRRYRPTGLPAYADLDAFNSCRMVSISWIHGTTTNSIPTPVYYIVKPDGFISTKESIAIHGITHEKAMENGISFDSIMEHLFMDLNSGVTRLVAHNLDFDINVLCNELYRRGMNERVMQIIKLQKYCTMLEGQKVMKVRKWPKLSELYSYLTNGEEISHAHNAMYDTMHCYKCYNILVKY